MEESRPILPESRILISRGLPASRRGESLGRIAILVAIIGGLFIGYILLLPPAEREQLLFGTAPVAPASVGIYTPGPGATAQQEYAYRHAYDEYAPSATLASDSTIIHSVTEWP